MRTRVLACLGLMALFLAVGAATAWADDPWTLAAAFSATANPNGPWSWGQNPSGPPGTFGLFPYHGTNSDGVDFWAMTGYSGSILWSPHFWENNQNYVIANVAPGEISFHPGPNHEEAVVRWTSPIAGPVEITGSFGQGDTGNVDLYIIKTDGAGTVTGSLFQVLNTASAQNFDLTTTVAPGNTIDFVLGDAGSWIYDNTPIAVTITPEPATLSLLALGGLAVIARRRRAVKHRV